MPAISGEIHTPGMKKQKLEGEGGRREVCRGRREERRLKERGKEGGGKVGGEGGREEGRLEEGGRGERLEEKEREEGEGGGKVGGGGRGERLEEKEREEGKVGGGEGGWEGEGRKGTRKVWEFRSYAYPVQCGKDGARWSSIYRE